MHDALYSSNIRRNRGRSLVSLSRVRVIDECIECETRRESGKIERFYFLWYRGTKEERRLIET